MMSACGGPTKTSVLLDSHAGSADEPVKLVTPACLDFLHKLLNDKGCVTE